MKPTYTEQLEEVNQMIDKFKLELKSITEMPTKTSKDYQRVKNLDIEINKKYAKKNQLLNILKPQL